MTQIFDESGNVVPVTVVEAGPCVVTQVKTRENDGYTSVQVGFGSSRKLNRPKQGHLKEAKVKYLREFRVEKPEEYKVGQQFRAEIFKAGELVAVSGISIGKGFAGNVKRHHHGRGPMTHGSKSHRIPGSIGAGTTPGRVFKGLRMPGRMGGEMVTTRNLRVVAVNADKNIILLRGSVPGKAGNLIVIKKLTEIKEEKPAEKKSEAKKE